MQTYRNHETAELISWPRPEEWETKPEIQFSVDESAVVAPGDRILVTTSLIKSGPSSGSVRDIYYYIDEVIDRQLKTQPESINELFADNKSIITAKAKRREV